MSRLVPAVLAATLALAPARAAAEKPHAGQVVRLVVTAQRAEERLPWMRSSPGPREATGVVVEGPFVLTTAQMVADATFIQVEKRGGPARAAARVHHIDHEINLALLAAEGGFLDDLEPAMLAPEAALDAEVDLARWDRGQLELSAGRIARLQVDTGPTSSLAHLFFSVKSDFAGGGWAEAVFSGGRLAGIVVSQDAGFAQVMPAAVLAGYLEAARRPEGYRGFGSLRLEWQENRDPALARWLGLEGEPRGVVVLGVPWGATGAGVLRPRDLLLELDGHAIGADGRYEHPRYGRVGIANIAVEGHQAGDRVPARVLREGREEALALELRPYPTDAQLVPWPPPGVPPPYLIAGGILFRELDRNYLAAWGKNWRRDADGRLLTHLALDADAQAPGRRRIVILSLVLPSPFNLGYHRLRDLPVRAVNGREVFTLADLDAAFRHPEGGYHVVSFRPNGARDELVLDAAGMEAADAAIRATYRIARGAFLPARTLSDLGPLPAAR